MGVLLGRGWQFPLRFDPHTKHVAMVKDVEDIEESLRILLSTHPGERVMQPAYGCGIRRAVFETLNESMLTELKDLIQKAVLFFEPRIILDQIDFIEIDPLHGRLHVVLDYRIRTTNTRHNLVYPMYLHQATDQVMPG